MELKTRNSYFASPEYYQGCSILIPEYDAVVWINLFQQRFILNLAYDVSKHINLTTKSTTSVVYYNNLFTSKTHHLLVSDWIRLYKFGNNIPRNHN